MKVPTFRHVDFVGFVSLRIYLQILLIAVCIGLVTLTRFLLSDILYLYIFNFPMYHLLFLSQEHLRYWLYYFTVIA